MLQKSTVVSFFVRFATVLACPSSLITLLFITRFFFSFLALRMFWKFPNRPCIILCAKAATSRSLCPPRSSSRPRTKHGVRSLDPQSLLPTYVLWATASASYVYVGTLSGLPSVVLPTCCRGCYCGCYRGLPLRTSPQMLSMSAGSDNLGWGAVVISHDSTGLFFHSKVHRSLSGPWSSLINPVKFKLLACYSFLLP